MKKEDRKLGKLGCLHVYLSEAEWELSKWHVLFSEISLLLSCIGRQSSQTPRDNLKPHKNCFSIQSMFYPSHGHQQLWFLVKKKIAWVYTGQFKSLNCLGTMEEIGPLLLKSETQRAVLTTHMQAQWQVLWLPSLHPQGQNWGPLNQCEVPRCSPLAKLKQSGSKTSG